MTEFDEDQHVVDHSETDLEKDVEYNPEEEQDAGDEEYEAEPEPEPEPPMQQVQPIHVALLV